MHKSKNKPGSIGTFVNGAECLIDLPRLLETRLLVQATSGGGKSYLLRRIFEQTAGKVQQIIIDPDGEFSSLREKFDYVIAAPHDGDALAHPRTAQLLARRLLETGVSAVLDIYDLKKQERQSFVRLFCEALIDAPKSLWHPVLVAIDEIHVFCPEKGKAESTGAVIDLATRGRKRGFSLIAATQRLAKFNKDAAAEMLNKLIGRTGLDVDVRRAQDELGFPSYREALDALRNLDPGEFFAFGPALSRSVETLKVGPVHTTHPQAGNRMLKAPPKPTAAIRAVLPKLADLPKEAASEARTLDELRLEVTSLRRELSVAKRTGPKAPEVLGHSPLTGSRVLKPVSKQANVSLEDVKRAVQAMNVAEAKVKDHERALAAQKAQSARDRKALRAAVLSAVQSVFEQAQQVPSGTPVKPAPPLKSRAATAPASKSSARTEAPRASREALAQKEMSLSGGDGALSGPEQRILNAIAWLETMTGTELCAQTAVAFLAGYTYGAGSFNNPKGKLRSQGLVEYASGQRIKLTEAGRSMADVPTTPLTEQELHERVLARLPGPERRILTPLLESYPEPMAGEDVATAANYVYGAGSFNNPRGRLRSFGLIEYLSGGQLIAAKCLFPQSAVS